MRPTAAFLVVLVNSTMSGLEVRKSAAEYPVQAKGQDFQIGADYTVRTFLADGQSFSIDEYLLVEVGLFPSGEANVNLQRFTLRLNGKNVLLPQTPGMVAASIKYPDWTRKPRLEVGAGPVVFGGQQPVGRFPGDRREPLPRRDPIGRETETNPIDYTQVVTGAALPEGKTRRPVAGYLYFAYNGKLKSIRSVELLIDGMPVKIR